MSQIAENYAIRYLAWSVGERRAKPRCHLGERNKELIEQRVDELLWMYRREVIKQVAFQLVDGVSAEEEIEQELAMGES